MPLTPASAPRCKGLARGCSLGAVAARCVAGSSLFPAAVDWRVRTRHRYVEGAFPEIDKAKVIEAAFGGQINCKVFRWGVADLAALMMKLGYFADPS